MDIQLLNDTVNTVLSDIGHITDINEVIADRVISSYISQQPLSDDEYDKLVEFVCENVTLERFITHYSIKDMIKEFV
jgi:hypothetical protein